MNCTKCGATMREYFRSVSRYSGDTETKMRCANCGRVSFVHEPSQEALERATLEKVANIIATKATTGEPDAYNSMPRLPGCHHDVTQASTFVAATDIKKGELVTLKSGDKIKPLDFNEVPLGRAESPAKKGDVVSVSTGSWKVYSRELAAFWSGGEAKLVGSESPAKLCHAAASITSKVIGVDRSRLRVNFDSGKKKLNVGIPSNLPHAHRRALDVFRKLTNTLTQGIELRVEVYDYPTTTRNQCDAVVEEARRITAELLGADVARIGAEYDHIHKALWVYISPKLTGADPAVARDIGKSLRRILRPSPKVTVTFCENE